MGPPVIARELETSYERVFQLRGAPYHRAMIRFPDARCEEFLNTIARAAPPPGAVVVDVPAGGGYLAKYLPKGCHWLGHEPCDSFGHGAGGQIAGLLPLPWDDAIADAAFSIAGVHHLHEKVPLFVELARVIRPGGKLVLADVHENSAVARFLDGWVDRHNSTGHRGIYLSDHTLTELKLAGWEIGSAERVAYHWRFDSDADLGEFCHQLFDLRTTTPAETIRTIETELGIDRMPDGVGMRWELFMVVATPATSGHSAPGDGELP